MNREGEKLNECAIEIMRGQLYHAHLHDTSSAYAAVMCSKWFKCFTPLAKPTVLIYSDNCSKYNSECGYDCDIATNCNRSTIREGKYIASAILSIPVYSFCIVLIVIV